MNSLLRVSIHHLHHSSTPAKPLSFLRSRYHSSTHQLNQQTVQHATPKHQAPSPIKPSPPSTSGKKFKDLVQDLQQRSLSLVELEAIQLPSNYRDQQKAGENEQSKAIASISNSSMPTDSVSRRRRRKDFEPDPKFQFERKRGKKHIMLALKQAKLNGGSTQSQKIELVDHLDLSLRWNGRLKKILFSLPSSHPPQSNPIPSSSSASASSSSASNEGTTEPQKTSTKEDSTSGIDEFVKSCLGPLVWSNPKVDITLVYSQEHSKPTLTFWTSEEATDDGSDEHSATKTVELEGFSRSQILRLVLNQEP
ncbi:hypothetical protein PGT21_023526 [Puccinia graminis f. sp. tritici]|uniref:Uncharacterized protein n=2 Tax=Puccinia graminis f. sp. tritici TaxID=56615 RepID=E3KR42_PUCGT|nr:uncharacterized protein PGTG_13149 [Puccinia graminis f. sp. tritici CRL 75-36-700-3]EFP86767.1 hypothetical protein PGTG_13149 [Puccinia graminis f. sp. tritici CRL 75-36-700-3]KAA1077909.1 hypothetical protein PGT21_023526 [Puccinia graminis f. sp. tritici]